MPQKPGCEINPVGRPREENILTSANDLTKNIKRVIFTEEEIKAKIAEADLLTSGGHTNYFVGTVEAAPSLDDVIAAVKAGEYKKVVLEPLMVVAGDHANNDMAGDEDDSWKSAFEKEGYEVTCLLRGLGENETIRQLYVAHAQAAVNAIAQ